VGRRVPGAVFGLLYAIVLGGLCINFFINPHQRVAGFTNLVIMSLALEAVGLLVRRPHCCLAATVLKEHFNNEDLRGLVLFHLT
jgi:hypothetical protein